MIQCPMEKIKFVKTVRSTLDEVVGENLRDQQKRVEEIKIAYRNNKEVLEGLGINKEEMMNAKKILAGIFRGVSVQELEEPQLDQSDPYRPRIKGSQTYGLSLTIGEEGSLFQSEIRIKAEFGRLVVNDTAFPANSENNQEFMDAVKERLREMFRRGLMY